MGRNTPLPVPLKGDVWGRDFSGREEWTDSPEVKDWREKFLQEAENALGESTEGEAARKNEQRKSSSSRK